MPEGWKRFGEYSAQLTSKPPFFAFPRRPADVPEGQVYFEGTLLGKRGKFVIAVARGKMADKVTAEWEIVEGSGT